jgi:DNA-binding response OmpR family regulator
MLVINAPYVLFWTVPKIKNTEPSDWRKALSSILVIEDEKGILGFIEAVLSRQGHCVKTATDGKEGIRKFDVEDFDMVITDVVMPEVSGLGVLQHIRDSSRHRVPIIGMSGTPWLTNDADFDVVLAKPFSLQQLVDSVRILMGAFEVSHAAA